MTAHSTNRKEWRMSLPRRALWPGGLCLLLAALLVGCAPAAPSPGPGVAQGETFPVTITDGAGRQVTVEREPQRIISLAPSNTEILFALGLGDKVVGVTTYCDYPEEAKAKPKIGGFATVNLELVVAAAPDLILASNVHAKKVVPELEAKGLTVVVMDPNEMEEVLANITQMGRLTGRDKEAEALVGQMGARIKEIEAKLATAKTSPRVFWEVSRELITAGPSSFIGDLIARAGGANIAKDTATKWPRLSQEVVIASDPEVIILDDHAAGVTPQEVAGRPGWQVMTAVKKGRVVPIQSDLVARAGPRIVEGFEMVARAIHPEVFP